MYFVTVTVTFEKISGPAYADIDLERDDNSLVVFSSWERTKSFRSDSAFPILDVADSIRRRVALAIGHLFSACRDLLCRWRQLPYR
jgi:hypothetical protein